MVVGEPEEPSVFICIAVHEKSLGTMIIVSNCNEKLKVSQVPEGH